MIKFFRKIRQKLLEQNRVSKYLLYAFGEIILVVIGILIALQINNWNEREKAKSYEITILQEVKEVMEIDMAILKTKIPYIENAQNSFYRLAIYKNQSTVSPDSLLFHLKIIQEYGTIFNINSSPFETIKSNGLDKISNATIRNQLSNLYGFEIPKAELWINEVLRVELFEKNNLFKKLFSVKAFPLKGIIKRDLEITNYSTIFSNPDFDELLLSGWPITNTISILKSILEVMEDLNEKITNEIIILKK